MKYYRNCPVCKAELFHTSVKERNRAEKLERLCRTCTRLQEGSDPFRRRHRKRLKYLQHLLHDHPHQDLQFVIQVLFAAPASERKRHLEWCIKKGGK